MPSLTLAIGSKHMVRHPLGAPNITDAKEAEKKDNAHEMKLPTPSSSSQRSMPFPPER